MLWFLLGVAIGLAIGWSTVRPLWFEETRLKVLNYLERM